MKVSKVKSPVTVTGDIQTKGFEIVFDRHMVKILSDQLYEDKALAIVRELSTNAVDSQKEAGTTKQFEVHLPNWDDMNFWIRDYGTGMTPDKVDNIYRKYGASDRSESNDFTGCMGLGSKTPFCYHTKTFTVDSWCNGKHYQYACFLDEDGMPQIAPMVEEPSDEPSGVKVTLPAKNGDRYDFEMAAENVYPFFEEKPKLFGRSVTIDKPNYTLEGSNWKYDEDEVYGMRIVMGNVAYKVNSSALGDLNTAQRKVVEAGFHVYVPIGSVSVTASREGLDYTNRTKTHIRSYINGIITDFNEKAQLDISQAKNLWEARKRFVEYERASLRGVFDASKITYDGNQLFGNDGYIDFSQMVKDDKLEVFKYTRSSWRQPERSRVRHIRISSGDNLTFFENDIKVGGFVRAMHVCKTEGKDVLLLKFNEEHDTATLAEIKAEWMEIVGLDSSYITNISTIPSPTVRSKNNRKRTKTTKVMEYIPGHHGLKTEFWKNADIEIEDGGIYVEFNRFSIKMNGCGNQHPINIMDIVSHLNALGIVTPTVYAVKTAVIEDFEQDQRWTDLWTWAKDQVKKKAQGKDLYSKEKYKSALDDLGYGSYYNRGRLGLELIHKLAAHCDDTTYLKRFSVEVKEVEALAAGYQDLKAMRGACNHFVIPITKTTVQSHDLKSLEDAVYAKYPLLTVMHDSQIRKCLSHIGLYVNAVDNV